MAALKVELSCLLIFLAVGRINAQVSVNVFFNPTSPVPIGETTFKCDFTLPAGDSLGEQYWQTVTGFRFFTYRPGQNPEVTISPEYLDKIISYDISNPNAVSIVFNVTACDQEVYICNVLGIPSTTDGDDQQALEVQNFALPVLKINDTVPSSGTVIVTSDTTVSCHLNNAGPPLPADLSVLIDNAAADTTSGYILNSDTCTWDYLIPAQTVITPEDVATNNKIAQCRVTYRNSGSRDFISVTLVSDPCSSNPCQNGGTCSSVIDGSGNAVFSCACPCATSGDFCQTTVCDSNPCGNYGNCSIVNCDVNCTCDEGVSGDRCELGGCLGNQCSDNSTCVPSKNDYTCDCDGDNIYGELCDTTGCEIGTCSCQNGGTCVDELDQCYCQCAPGCAGASCETFEEGDLCETSCSKENRVSCSQTCDSYNCMCKQGFTGPHYTERGRINAQVSVAVSFNPPSPVPIGETTFTCDFTLTEGDSLGDQYWQIIGGSRFFTYRPGQIPEVTITPEYQDKVLSYDISNPGSVSIVFNVTACDVEQYYCNILGLPSATEGNDQQSLEVHNLVEPVIKINGSVPVFDRIIVTGDTTVSCHLNKAGPPLPIELTLRVMADFNETTDYLWDSATCMWDYLTSPQLVIPEDITSDQLAQCRADYREGLSQFSPLITLVPGTPPIQTEAGGADSGMRVDP